MRLDAFSRLCLLLLAMTALPSCSLLIHSTRKSVADLVPSEATRDQIRSNFGKVVSCKDYSAPRTLQSIPELKENRHWFPEDPGPRTIGYDNYRYFGALQSDMAGTVVGMGIGMTLGLSEFYFIPEEFSERKLEKERGNHFRVYYAEDGHWIVFRRGEEGSGADYVFNKSYWEKIHP